MRSLLLLVVFALATTQTLSATISSNKIYTFDKINPAFVSRILENELNETLECLRYTLETGLPEIDLPSLVSIDIPELNLDLESLGLDGTGGYFHVKSGVFRGLTTLHAADLVTSLTLDPVAFSADITLVLAEFYLELDYDMDMSVDGIYVFGDGKVIIDWKDVTVQLQFVIDISESISISGVNIYISLGSSYITITGWFNDEEHSQVVTDLINDYLIPQWINGQTEEISEVLGPIIEVIVNLLLLLVDDSGAEPGEDLVLVIQAISNHCAGRTDDISIFLK